MKKQPTKKSVEKSVISTNEISTIEDWQKVLSEVKRIELPSGIVVEVRKLDLPDLIVAGFVPLPLLSNLMAVGESLKKGKIDIKQEDLTKMQESLRRIAVEAVAKPSLSIDGIEGTMDVTKISTFDLIVIFKEAVNLKGIGSDFASFL